MLLQKCLTVLGVPPTLPSCRHSVTLFPSSFSPSFMANEVEIPGEGIAYKEEPPRRDFRLRMDVMLALSQSASFRNGPNTVSERTVGFQTRSSVRFFAFAEFRGENSVSSSQPSICVPRRTH